MSALVGLLLVMLAAVGAASHRKETSTSTAFLRLTASRSDEGVWTARFGEYEISIELKHNIEMEENKDLEDTWTLKIRHTSKPGKQWKFKNNEISEDENNLQTDGNTQPWKNNFDSIEPHLEKRLEDFPKFDSTRKMKKSKSRRQLKLKPLVSATESSFSENPEENTNLPTMEKTPVFKEISQDNRHLEVAFNKEDNETDAVTDAGDSFLEMDNNTWHNVAAVIFESPAQERNDTEYTTPEALPDQEIRRLSDAYVLPLIQIREGVDYIEDRDRSSNNSVVENNNDLLKGDNNSTTTERNFTELTTQGNVQRPQDFERDTDYADYVIEDYNTRKEKEDSNEEMQDVSAERVPEISELTPEMKRILDWFPRSRLLTTENNGYKLFPEVGWFKLVTWPERWFNASRVCESEQAHLAVPDSEDKVRVFLQIFRNYPDLLEQGILQNQVYVGVQATGPDRNFRTVQGIPFRTDLPIWFPGEPDNADPGEDCVTFHLEGRIRDVPCFYNLPFLCEKN